MGQAAFSQAGIVYFRIFLGNFIFIFPSLILSWGIKRKNRFYLRFAAAIGVMLFVIVILSGCGLAYRNNLGVPILLHIFSIAIFAICNDVSLNAMIYCKIWSTALYYFELQIPISMTAFLPVFHSRSIYALTNISGMLLVSLIIFLCFRKEKQKCLEQITYTELVLTAAITVFVIATDRILFLGFNKGDAKNILYAYQLISMLFVILILFLQLYTHNVALEKKEMQLKENTWEMEKKYFQIRKEEMETVNHKCHDLKYQIAALKAEKEETKAQEIISDLEKAVMIYDTAIKTDNIALKMLLIDKQKKFQDGNIVFHCIVDMIPNDFMDVSDLYIFLGNALDNAYDSVCLLEESDRKIELRMIRDGSFVRILIQNPYKGEIKLKHNIPQTTKGTGHGYGFHSIKKIIQKYHGNMIVDTENHLFCLKILLPCEKTV